MTLLRELAFGGRFGAEDMIFGADLRDLEIAVQGGQAVLYGINGLNGGISRWQLDAAGGAPQLAGQQLHGQAGLRTGAFELAMGGPGAQLVQAQVAQGELTFYRLAADGSLGAQQQMTLAGAGAGGFAAVTMQALAAGGAGFYAVDAADGQLRGWQLDAAGALRGPVATVGGGEAYVLEPDALLSTVALPGGGAVLLAADGQGLHGFALDLTDGDLRAGDTLDAAQGLSLGAITVLEGFAAHGNAWALVGAAGNSALCLLRLEADGGLVLEAQFQDSMVTRFGGISALEVVQAGPHMLVLAAGNDGGLSLFTLTPGGQLIHLRSLEHEVGLGLQNVTALEAVVLDGQLQVFVACGAEMGISRFTLPLDRLGLLEQAAAGQAQLEGSSRDDLLEAGSAEIALLGHAGDDVLVSGAGGGWLEGGAGADVFAIGASERGVTVRDFTPGEDRLDLSQFEGLTNLEQLNARGRSAGMVMEVQGTLIVLMRAGGGRLELEDVFGPGLDFVFAERRPAGETRLGGSFYGSDGSDQITGTAGRDAIWGQDGWDHLIGGGERDTLKGGNGRDTLEGGSGRDRLEGNGSRDILKGGDGWDTLKGGGGWDRLEGGNGKDMLKGGSGEDMLEGGHGNDRLRGQSGADTLEGGYGNDKLEGGRGSDWLKGGNGSDVFVFASRHGTDRVADFTIGSDRLDLGGTAARRFSDLDISSADGGTLIRTGSGKIFLEDLHPAQLDADDFLF